MAREQFGNTWWGEQWLASLSKIDYSNRIPRGLSYARNGMVDQIEIKNATIYTKVKGSRPKPYKITLSMGQISKEKVSAMLDNVMEYPTIVSRLLNGKMDPKLLDIAEESGVKLFPTSSKDMTMDCSCPDWAVPCKHLAASIYKVCSDIDTNPFVLFEFRGIDLPAMLAKRDINVFDIQNQMVISQQNFYAQHQFSVDSPKIASLPTIDYSKLIDRREELIALLEDQPAFYTTGDFKNTYQTQLKVLSKTAQRILDERVDLSSFYASKNTASSLEEIPLTYKKGKLETGNFNLGSLLSYDNNVLELSPFSTRYYHQILNLALHCISKGIINPELIEKKDNKYVIMWMPATLDATIKKIIEDHKNLEGIELEDKIKGDTFITLCIFITELIHLFSQKIDSREDRFLALFFTATVGSFDGLSESSIPNAISRWLRLFRFDLGDYYPVIKVEEKNGSFYIDIQIGVNKGLMNVPIAFSDFIKTIKDKSKLFDFYKDLDLLSHYMPDVGVYINKKGEESLEYSAEELPNFLFNIQPIMKLLGIKVVLPTSLKHLIRPKKSVSLSARNEGDSSGFLGLANMLSFDWKISLGNQIVTVKEFKELVNKAGKLIKYKSQYIYMNESDFVQLQKEISKNSDLSNIELLSIALSEEYEGAQISLSEEVRLLIASLTNFDTIEQPKGLKAKFRPYQLRGYSWMVKNVKIGVGSIIADDMGLGKTLQVIALIAHLVESDQINQNSKAIIIVPTSLIPNWEAEFLKFAPGITTFTYYGGNRSIDEIQSNNIIITSYGTVRSDVAELKKYKWTISVIDEAQNIKNPASQQTKSIKFLKADHNIAMSGTPVENRLMDYWSVMDYVNKGLLGNRTSFSKVYDKPITKEHNQEVLNRFKKVTAPFIMRRMKTDKTIISDLPDKIMNDTYAALTPKQSALYQKVVNEALTLIKAEEQNEDTSLFKRQGLVLQMILSLKQICNHPSQWLKDGQNDLADSGKLQLLIDIMSSIIEAGNKALIFTQFREMGDIISTTLEQEMGINPLWLHGGVSLNKRKEMVEQFQNQDHQKVMILSLKAGGTGLNLTAANHVIHYDLWWNPAVEAQATDRAFRIGQNKNVFVHRFITQHTFEEKINDLINSKKALADLTVTSGENWIGELKGKELEEIFLLK